MPPIPEQVVDLAEPLLPLITTADDEELQDDDHDPTSNINNTESAASLNNPYKNHNVRLCLALCAVSGIADSVWGSVVLSGFLYALASAMHRTKQDNTLVGLAEMVQGITMLISALPIGMWADRTGKAKVARMGGALMLVTIGITLWALLVVDREAMENVNAANQSYMIMLVALALWGIVGGISNGPTQALFADSIPRGKRSELLTWLYSCYLISSSIGPIVSIAMLSSSSAEDWSIAETFPVFFAGVVLEVPAAVLMFFFSEKHVVPEDETSNVQSTNTVAIDSSFTTDELAIQEPLVLLPVEPNTRRAVDDSRRRSYTRLMNKEAVPYVLFISSLVVAIGSGASVKYFPLFFKEIGLSSSVVQGIYFVVPVSIAGFSFVGQKLGKRFGRIETSAAFNTAGTLLLYYLTWLSQNVNDGETVKKSMIVFIYLLRTGIMNCCYPLLESVLMDAVPSNQRAKWKSLESISSFGWTGSALVGGILSDKHSYQYTFSMTATVQLVGGLMLLPIRSFVESEEGCIDAPVAQQAENCGTATERGDLPPEVESLLPSSGA